jgi:predicted phosphodiesterase
LGLSQSPLDPYIQDILDWLAEGKDQTEIARLLKRTYGVKTSRHSIRRALKRNNVEIENTPHEQSGVTLQGDSATVTTEVTTEDLGDFEELVRARGLDPAQWAVESVKVNEWDAHTEYGIEKMRQMKISLKKKFEVSDFFPKPAQPIKIFTPVRSSKKIDSFLAVALGDEQEPYGDPYVIESTLAFIEHNQPEVIVHLGDVMDLPTISRHKDNPEWAAGVQDCINAGYMRLRSYREAAPNARILFLVGNHDERLRNELLLRAERMYGIRPADIPGEPPATAAYSPQNLLRLDELAIEFIDPEGGYAHAQVNLSNELGVRHGWLTGENTAGKTLDRLGHSIIVGHTHAQRLTQKTIYTLDGHPRILTAAEAGTLSQVETGLGYTVNPNWQQGFVTAQIWNDGSFHLDLATYDHGALKWRDQRFSTPHTVSVPERIENVIANELLSV